MPSQLSDATIKRNGSSGMNALKVCSKFLDDW